MTVELRPLGVACNIACHYCYQNPQREAGNFRQPYQMERMKAAVEREGGPFTLFGGEPLLLPLADLEELFRWGLQTYGRSAIQTNGTLLNDEHIRLFKQYNVDVGISIDGPGELNDLRWHVNLEKTRRSTERVQANIERLCREYRRPGLIVTLHRQNATATALPRLHAWVRQIDALGIRSMRLHLLEAENEYIRQNYSLSDEENMHALLSFADLQSELTSLRFDVLDEMVQSLRGQDYDTSCVWRACDPYTTEAVHGVEGNGQSSNCGRTNKDGVDFVKAKRAGYERYLALYQTPQEDGGCKDCRFFMMCKGQCPGTALHGDWRNRSELCGVWKQLFTHQEQQLLQRQRVPLSLHPQRARLEQRMLEHWERGNNSPPLHTLLAGMTDAPSDPVRVNNDFHLPAFVRSTFVGERQRAIWEPRLEAVRDALARLGVEAVHRQIVPCSLLSVAPAEVFAIHNQAAAYGLHTRLLTTRTNREMMVVGDEQITARYQDAWEKGERVLLDELSAVPLCCQDAHRRLTYRDPVWSLIAGQQTPPEYGRGDGLSSSEVDVQCPPALNMLFKPLDLSLLNYWPCSLHCEASQRLAETLIALGREVGMAEAMDWLLAILDWPVEWSALHGIAELKSGIIKLAYDTDFTHEKLTVRYHGRTQAIEAARGLSFAYRTPSSQRRLLATRNTKKSGQ
jgi:uncharacterized protein